MHERYQERERHHHRRRDNPQVPLQGTDPLRLMMGGMGGMMPPMMPPMFAGLGRMEHRAGQHRPVFAQQQQIMHHGRAPGRLLHGGPVHVMRLGSGGHHGGHVGGGRRGDQGDMYERLLRLDRHVPNRRGANTRMIDDTS
mmetsp:Transcript_27203/g.59102  ORF Transcript_27203/g.59102 Transcript_27203/m.59102 type:complete len:140 (-) Transcript_27203:298-717(-)